MTIKLPFSTSISRRCQKCVSNARHESVLVTWVNTDPSHSTTSPQLQMRIFNFAWHIHWGLLRGPQIQYISLKKTVHNLFLHFSTRSSSFPLSFLISANGTQSARRQSYVCLGTLSLYPSNSIPSCCHCCKRALSTSLLRLPLRLPNWFSFLL